MSYLSSKTSNLDPVINYVSNGRAYNSTEGWVTYADVAGTQPVDGTGGSPTVTWARSTTTPLRQGADFNFTTPGGGSSQGQGVSYDFTIDNADLAKVLTVTFDYEVLSGTYATGDLTVYLIQDPSGTPVVIQPAGYQIQSATVGTKMRQIATFQTASNVTSYRLCLHVASVSASAYSLAVDNVVVGPQVVQYGAPVTDWVSYTPTFTGFGTATGVEFYWRRVGSNLEITGKFTTGTTTAVEGQISLPSGLTSVTKAQGITVAGVMIDAYNAATRFSLYTLIESASTYMVFGAQDSGSHALTKATGSQLLSSSAVTLTFTCQIQGWSSTVQMSNDTDTRVVAVTATGGNGSASTSTPFVYNTILFDTHGAFTTGAGSNFTAPVSGIYNVTVSDTSQISGTASRLYVYKNGSLYRGLFNYNDVATYRQSGSVLVELVAGDYIDIRASASTTYEFGAISINRLSGPSAIAASETVAARFSTGSTQALTTTPAIINFATISYDTHGAVTTGASWKFTAPIAGKYRVTARLLTAVGTTIMRIDYGLFKNGVAQTVPVTATQQAATSLRMDGSGSDCIQLVAGDYIDLRGACSTGSNSLAGDGTYNFVVIERIGN